MLEKEEKIYNRREFLKIAGVAGAAVGVGAGLGGLVAACGGTEETTTTTGAATTTTGGATTTTTAAETTTTVTAGAQAGRLLKVGVTVPMTGPLAEFGKPIEYCLNKAMEVSGGKVVTADGIEHEIKFITADTQSDSNRAAQVTGDLITNQKVDIVTAEGGPDSVIGPADQAEALGCPGLFTNVPWTAFIFGRGATMETVFKWTYVQAIGTQENATAHIDAWNRYAAGTNKKVALLYPNNANGIEYSNMDNGVPPVLTAAGYTYVMPDLYPPGGEDYTQQISAFKKGGCEIVDGSGVTPEFATFWKQALQQGFHPKLVTNGIALLFPAAAEAIGPTITNAIKEVVFHPTLPYKSPLTGQTCQQLADDYEKVTGFQWTGILNVLKLFEWSFDVFKRTKNVDDPASIADAVKTTKMDTIQHPIDFTLPVGDKRRPHPNVCLTPVIPGQWQKGKGKWPFDEVVVGDGGWTEFAPPVGGDVLGMVYS
jgi:branched-chain amino acid transport system substrate-binding protein